MSVAIEALEPLQRLRKDIRAASITLTPHEARYLVDTYYMLQEDRKRAANQVLALDTAGEPHEVVSWLLGSVQHLEDDIRKVLDTYSASRPLGRWARSIVGIGPVISAGLMCHIDIERAPTVGHIWRFAGLDPTQEWGKGEKRPWNASLKTLCWKIGESFVKVKGNDADVYGKVYDQRKQEEAARNLAGAYADQAAAVLKRTPGHAQAATYRRGILPDGHLHARAKRYTTKLFLAHWHQVAYELHHGKPAPKPYIIEHGGHVHFIAPPNWPLP